MGNLTVKESGEMVNFISPNVNNITSFKVHFSPKQEGEGDPSPENVREIVGWNGVEGYKCGKNVGHAFGYSAKNVSDTTNIASYTTTNNYGTTISTTTFNLPDTELVVTQSQATEPTTLFSYRNGYIAIGINNLIFEQTYNVSFKVSNITNNLLDTTLDKIRLLNPYGGLYSVSEIVDDRVIFKNVLFRKQTANPNRKSFEIRICGFSFTLSEFMVTAVDNEDFTYEPYQGTTVSTDWTDDIGAIYGGYVDLVSGELVAEYEYMTDTWGNWGTLSDRGDGTELRYKKFTNAIVGGSAGYDVSYCNVAKYNYNNNNGKIHFYNVPSSNNCRIYLPSGTDESLQIQAVGKLVEPIHYQLTPQQLSTLKGQNNFWSNADYVEIEYELTETFDIQKAKRKIILSQPHVESVSGNIVTFDTDMRGKLKECKVYFSPMQEGEGDPSPDNIRNIVGWNGVEEYSCGKNLFNMETAVEGYIDTTGKKINSPDQENMTSDFILVIEGETYTWTHYPTRTGVNYWTGYAFYSSKDMDSVIGSRTVKNSLKPIYITVPTDAKYIRIGSRYLNGGNAQLEKGSIENVSYEPYQATTTSIDWTNDIGTVYGGYVDLVSGELVNEYASIVLTGAEEGWQFYGAEIEGGHIFSNSKITNHIGGTQRPTEEFCTHFPMSRNWKTILNTCIVGESGLIGFTVDNSIAETVEEFTQFLAEQYANGTPVRLVYKIYISYYANYTIYQLTPQQLTALRGTNTIYSNANGQIDIKYWTRFPKINYMKDVQWLDHSYITSAGKLTEESTALSHTTVDSIFLPAGNYRIDGFCYQEPPANSLNCRVHEYSAGGSWIKLITSNAANTMSPYILEFSLDHDSYIKLSLPRLLDAKLIKI